MKKILITGGKGYLGARLCDYFSSFFNHQIYVSSRTAEKLSDFPSIKVIPVNTAKDDLIPVLKDIDIIIHLAALDALACAQKPLQAIHVNIGDTAKWLEAASKTKVSQFIYFSTVHVYGSSMKGNINEHTLAQPMHPYSITHKCAEDYVLEYGNRNGFKSHVFRLSNSMGYPKGVFSQENLLVPDLCKSAVINNKITLKSNPKIQRDFIAIEDVCRAVDFLIAHSNKCESGIYNLSSGASLTLLEMAKKIQDECAIFLHKTPEIEFLWKESNEKFEQTLFRISNNKLLEKGFLLKNDYSKEVQGVLSYFKEKFTHD